MATPDAAPEPARPENGCWSFGVILTADMLMCVSGIIPWKKYVQVTKYLEYKGKFSTRTQAGRLFGVWGALLHFNIDKSYKKLVKST